MAKVAGELLEGLDKETVETVPTTTAPSRSRGSSLRVPNLLVNGAPASPSGWPPPSAAQPGEVIGALLALIGDPTSRSTT